MGQFNGEFRFPDTCGTTDGNERTQSHNFFFGRGGKNYLLWNTLCVMYRIIMHHVEVHNLPLRCPQFRMLKHVFGWILEYEIFLFDSSATRWFGLLHDKHDIFPPVIRKNIHEWSLGFGADIIIRRSANNIATLAFRANGWLCVNWTVYFQVPSSKDHFGVAVR